MSIARPCVPPGGTGVPGRGTPRISH
jgi:hypothetical protein